MTFAARIGVTLVTGSLAISYAHAPAHSTAPATSVSWKHGEPITTHPEVPVMSAAPKQPKTAGNAGAANLSARALAAAQKRDLMAVLSPLLPSEWPPTSPSLQMFAYHEEAQPTSIVTYSVRGPTLLITFTGPQAEPQLQALDAPRELGRSEPAAQQRFSAEQALVDVVSGTRSADEARADLHGYLDWSRSGDPLADDVRERCARLLAWLQALPVR